MGVAQWIRAHLATLVTAGVVAALVGASLIATRTTSGDDTAGLVAVIHAGDGTTRTLPLNVDATLRIETELGTNVVAVADGAIHMAEADCPNGSCLHQRGISALGEQIVCLPHRLWIEVTATDAHGGTEPDISAVTWDDDTDDNVDLIAR